MTINSPIHTLLVIQGTPSPIGDNIVFNVMLKDTMMDWEGAGFEPSTPPAQNQE